MRLPRPGGGAWHSEAAVLVGYLRDTPNGWTTSRMFTLYRSLSERRMGTLPVLLHRLFWLSEGVEPRQLEAELGENRAETLKQEGILRYERGLVWASVRCFSYKGLYLLHDVSRAEQDFVYFGGDSRVMMDVVDGTLGKRRFGNSLDLCTGSGVQGIHLARRSEQQVCVDLNPRAVAFAALNACVNGLANVKSVQSDLFSNVTGRYDCISANTPYVPLAHDPNAADLPLRGGDMGTEFTMRLIEALPNYLSEQGMAILYTSDPVVRGQPLLQRDLEQRFSHLPYRMDQILLFRNRPQTESQRRHWRAHDLDAFDDCILLVRPGSPGQRSRRAWSSSFYWRTRLAARLAPRR